MFPYGLMGKCEDCNTGMYLRVVPVDPETCEPLQFAGPTNPAQRQVVAGSQVLAFNDSTQTTLTIPAGANLAEISVEDGDARFTTDGINADNATKYGHRVMDGGRIELESLSEVQGFHLTGLPGEAGTIYVEYFFVPYLGYANA